MTRQYEKPFWRAPYRECRDSVADRLQIVELDEATLVTEVVTYWRVAPNRRTFELARAESEITRLFGSAFRCSPTSFVWRGSDSVRVALLLQNDSDVVDSTTLETTDWKISRYARLGPLPDAVWCQRAGTPGSEHGDDE